MRETFRNAMEAYRAASEIEDEGPCLAYLALSSHRLVGSRDPVDSGDEPVLVRPDYPRRFQAALARMPLGPELRRQVDEALAPAAA